MAGLGHRTSKKKPPNQYPSPNIFENLRRPRNSGKTLAEVRGNKKEAVSKVSFLKTQPRI